MKLFWKIFLSIMTVIIVVFCVSGHILIYSFFRSLLKNEIETAEKSNLSFCLSMESLSETEKWPKESVELVAARKAAGIQVADDKDLKQLNIYSEEFKAIYKREDFNVLPVNLELLKRTDANKTAYTITEKSGEFYLVTVNKVSVGEQKLYVECVNMITDTFRQKDKQYQIFGSCILILIAVIAGITWILTGWIVSPVIEEFRMAAVRQEEFTGSFAHELKTPLTSIIGYADMLRSKKMTEETRMLYGNYIFQQGKRLESLSKKMLELIVLQKTDFAMREVFLEDLLEQVREELDLVLGEKKIVLETDVKEISLRGEPDLLKTVLLNLLDNSMKAIGENGKILVLAENGKHETVICVTDNGKGIPQNEISKVTESFYMVDKSRKYDGGSSGLGLAICKRVLDLHHAKMEIESEEGKGTTVRLRFEVSV